MRYSSTLLSLLLVALCAAGCRYEDTPVDIEAQKWTSLLNRHEKLLQEGKFDAEAFRVEAEPIAIGLRELGAGAGALNGMRSRNLEAFNDARDQFDATLKSKGKPEDLAVYREMVAIWHKAADQEGDTANKPAREATQD